MKVALALLALAACSKSSAQHEVEDARRPPDARVIDAPGPRATHAAAVRAVVAELCACKDVRCARPAAQKLEEVSKNAPRAPSTSPHGYSYDLVHGNVELGVESELLRLELEAQMCRTRAERIAEMPMVPMVTTDRVEEMLSYAYQNLATDRSVVTSIDLDFVHADGRLSRTYGSVRIETGRMRPPDPADDPERPIGAPVDEPPPRPEVDDADLGCPVYKWYRTTAELDERPCGARIAITRPRCRVTEIWERAIKDRAPATALAKLSVVRASDGKEQSWSFRIIDPPRKIDFRRDYPDDCALTVERTTTE